MALGLSSIAAASQICSAEQIVRVKDVCTTECPQDSDRFNFSDLDLQIEIVSKRRNPVSGDCPIDIFRVERDGFKTLIFRYDYFDDMTVVKFDPFEFRDANFLFRIHISECRARNMSEGDAFVAKMTIQRHSCPENKSISSVSEWSSAGPVRWMFSGEEIEREYRPPETIAIQAGTKQSIAAGLVDIQKIRFERDDEFIRRSGFQLGPLVADLQARIGLSQSGGREQGTIDLASIEISGDVCDRWVIRRFEVVRNGLLSAPQLGLPNEVPFQFVVSRRVAAEPADGCDPRRGITVEPVAE